MTNRIAIFLGLALIVAFSLEYVFFGEERLIFLGKKFAELIEWLAFWR